MGQQQLLLILLGVILVGFAIVLTSSLVSSQSIQVNRDAMINDLSHIAAHAYQYRVSAGSLGGGAGTYTGYEIPGTLRSNANGTYRCTVEPDYVVLTAISSQDSNSRITAKIDSRGLFLPDGWNYSGNFQ